MYNYIDFIIDTHDRWHQMFKNVKDFILENNKSPSSIGDTSNERLLGQLLSSQRGAYNNKSARMKKTEYYNLWTEFTNNPLYLQKPISTKTKKKRAEKLPKVDLNSVGLKLVETASKPIPEPKKENPKKASPKKIADWQKQKTAKKDTKELVMVETKKTKASKPKAKPKAKAAPKTKKTNVTSKKD